MKRTPTRERIDAPDDVLQTDLTCVATQHYGVHNRLVLRISGSDRRLSATLGAETLDAMNNWKQIRLELANTADFPAGSVGRAYLLRLPIADDDHVDRAAYREDPSRAVVRRHWSTEPDQSGHLIEAGEDWIVRCDGETESRLELDGKPLRLGQHIPLKLGEGIVLPLRIASIR